MRAAQATTHGPLVAAWMEETLVHGPGDLYGRPYRLTDDQRRFVDRLYACDGDGRLVVRRALLGRAKGWAKTELAAAVALERFAGPLTPPSPEVVLAAASYDQAGIAYGTARAMVDEGPLRAFIESFENEMLFRDGSPGRLFRVAAQAGTADGLRPTACVYDELHEWTGNKERVAVVLGNGLRKRAGGLELAISTAGVDLDESLLGKLYQRGRRIESGEQPAEAAFLFDWAEADAGLDLADPEQRRVAALQANPHADLFGITDGIVQRWDEVPAFEWTRYHANRWTRTTDCWLPAGVWEDCEGDASIPAAGRVTVGVDVALKHDSTAVVAVHRDEAGRFRVASKVWGLEGDRLDVAAVEGYLRDLHRRFRVDRVAYDPAYFERSAQVLADEGLPMVELPQTSQRMVPACQNAYRLIVDRNVVHGGDATLTDHVLSAVQRETDMGWRLSKGRSKRKIDACIALVLALELAAGPEPEPEEVQIFVG